MNQQLALIQNDDTPQVEATNYAPKEVGFVKPFEQQLQLIEGEFSKFVFDYSKPDDNEKARSLIRKLQKSRAAIEKVAKAERDPAILYQRHVIDEEKKLTVRVQKLIDQYEKPLKEWEAQDKLRQDEIKAMIAAIRPSAEWTLTASAGMLKHHLATVEGLDTDSGVFAEFSAEAFAARILAIEYLKEHVAIAEKREADAARLAQLEAEAEARRIADEEAAAKAEADRLEAERVEREKQEVAEREAAAKKVEEERAAREKQLQEEAAAKAKADAEAEAARVAQEAADREQKLKDEAAAADAARIAAEEKAARDKKAAEELRQREAKEAEERQAAAVEAERKRIADAAAKQKAIDDAREADRNHRAKINRAVVDAMIDIIRTGIEQQNPAAGDVGTPEKIAKAIITEVALGKIPHIKIVY